MEATITFEDAYGRQTRKRYTLTTETLEDAITAVEALISDLVAVSDLGVAKYEISVVTPVAGQPPAQGSNVDVGATLSVRLDNAKLYPFKIPGISASLLNADGSVKIDNAAITGLIDNFEQGGDFRVSETNYIVDVLFGMLDR